MTGYTEVIQKNIVLCKEGVDRLYGYAGDEILFGGEGDDSLYGGDDNVTLIGGPGNDVMYGGAGADTYVFIRGDGEDIILDEKYNNDLANFISQNRSDIDRALQKPENVQKIINWYGEYLDAIYLVFFLTRDLLKTTQRI